MNRPRQPTMTTTGTNTSLSSVVPAQLGLKAAGKARLSKSEAWAVLVGLGRLKLSFCSINDANNNNNNQDFK